LCHALFPTRLLRPALLAAGATLLLLMPSCITTPFLKKGQYLLINQRVKGSKTVHREELEVLFHQRANRKILGITPYLGFYFFGKSIWDSSRIRRHIREKEAYYDARIRALPPGSFQDSLALEARKERKCKKHYLNLAEGNWWMRVVGEPPAIYDSSLARETRREIRNFMFNKGFFQSQVVLEEDTFIGGNIAVRYRIREGPRRMVRSVAFRTDDYRLSRLIDSSRAAMLTRAGYPYMKESFDSDREQLERLFRDKGYFTFSREYIKIQADTALRRPETRADSLLFKTDSLRFLSCGMDVTFTILNPPEGRHRAYVLESIEFEINESEGAPDQYRDTLYNGIHYRYARKKRYSLGVLDGKVLLHPRQYFNYSRLTNTQAQLSAMDMFRLVNLNLDTSGQTMRLRIVANRLPKYQSSEELGMLISQGAPGPYANAGLKIRNIFGGFELFDIGVRYSQEGQLSTFLPQDVVFRARDLTITSSFTISKILFPFRLNERIYEFNPKTRFLFSLSAIKRPEYIRNLIKGALNYTLNLSPTRQLGISPVDVTVNITPEDRLNRNYLEQLKLFSGLGQSVEQSFQQSVVTNFNAYYMYNTNTGGQKKKSRYFRVNAEYGGELLFRVLNTLLDKEKFQIGKYKIFRYARASADFRVYNPVRKNTMLAFRLSGGVAVPVGASQVLPWEKYAFAGGSNSIRAWLPRRLGPGSYAPPNSDPNNLRTEQPGEMIVESSVEVRQKLVGFLEGAVFLDAGNVWNLRRDAQRPGAEISPLFWKQLAFGGGFGLRFDFSFLVVRVDAATKLYNPAFSSAAGKWQIRNLSFSRPFGVKGQTLLNVGIGYPF
jgi:outer membrane protein insertion porin family